MHKVADGYDDHAFWGRPEQMTMFRPSYALTSSMPGADVAGETAAALAAGAMVFKAAGGTHRILFLSIVAETAVH